MSSLNQNVQIVNKHHQKTRNPNSHSVEYTTLKNIHHSARHRGKQKSYASIATDLSQLTRLSSKASAIRFKYSEIASVASAYSSFVPNNQTDLLQIEYDVKETEKCSQRRIIYAVNLLLFIIFYILLFVPDANVQQIARYLILCSSLSISLIYTMMPTYFPIPIPIFAQNATQMDAQMYNAAGQQQKQEIFMITVKKFHFALDQSTVPIICVLLLMASMDSHFSAEIAWNAMIGRHSDIKPWAVLGILFGLCYLCITLDLTGILKAFAQKTAAASNSFQHHLFFYIFIFAAALTVMTNNDISIICLTPLVISTANSAKIDAKPFIFMVLFTSNTFSMLLITGNPANLIVSAAAKCSYIEYMKWMALPTFITGTVYSIPFHTTHHIT